MARFGLKLTRKASVTALAAVVTVSAAGATTIHRMSISQTSGSLGSQTVLQTTATGGALQGEVNSSPNTSIKIPFGVLGEYDASSGPAFGIGVEGISTTGYAVAGEALSSQPSVIGFAGGSGVGVQGVTPTTSTAAAVNGTANGGGNGGLFFSHSSTAVEAYTPGIGGVAYLGEPTGEGLAAYGYSGGATDPAIAGYGAEPGTDLIGLYSSTNNGFQENFIVRSGTLDESGGALLNGSDVQVSGDLFVYGHIYQDCDRFPAASGTACYEQPLGTGVTLSAGSRSSKPQNVSTYGGRQSVPTVEDFGQAQIVGGRAYVHLDPAFAATTNPGSPYLVFVTPEGDSRGVFTANHSMNGFEIHENTGGRSTMVVDYRIVAKPLGDRSQRFQPAQEQKRGYTGAFRPVDRQIKREQPAMARPLISTTSFAR